MFRDGLCFEGKVYRSRNDSFLCCAEDPALPLTMKILPEDSADAPQPSQRTAPHRSWCGSPLQVAATSAAIHVATHTWSLVDAVQRTNGHGDAVREYYSLGSLVC